MSHFAQRFFRALCALALAACGSVSTIENPYTEAVDAGLDASSSDDAAGGGGSGGGGGEGGGHALICDTATSEGEPCVADADCVGVSVCEVPRCNDATGFCIVTVGPDDGTACDNGNGVCIHRRCCK